MGPVLDRQPRDIYSTLGTPTNKFSTNPFFVTTEVSIRAWKEQ